MDTKILAGKKIAVIVENKFIYEEIEAYRTAFTIMGAEVDFVSRIYYGDYKPQKTTFYSDIDPLDNQPWETPHTLDVSKDISTIKVSDYAIIIMSANYTSVRLRWNDFDFKNSQNEFDVRDYIRSAPLPKFFADAMTNNMIIKGALCHGLWILSPFPELLKGRKVTCHPVVMADIFNCGADIQMAKNGVVIDNDLVTGFSKHEVHEFILAMVEQLK